jgi:hypothetical protein
VIAEVNAGEGFMSAPLLLLISIACKDHAFGVHPPTVLLQSVKTRCRAKCPIMVTAYAGGLTRDIDAINVAVTAHAGGGEKGGGKNFITRFDHQIL